MHIQTREPDIQAGMPYRKLHCSDRLLKIKLFAAIDSLPMSIVIPRDAHNNASTTSGPFTTGRSFFSEFLVRQTAVDLGESVSEGVVSKYREDYSPSQQ